MALRRRSAVLGRPATLDDFDDAWLDEIAAHGFDWVWLLGVWQTGEAGRAIARNHQEWRRGFLETLPDLQEADICGSSFAVTGYTVHTALGGDPALARLRAKLAARGCRLMLDFVPNHTALDHPWARERSSLYIAGTDSDLAREPHNYARIDTIDGSRILARGRDPYFPAWPDTLQLNYTSPGTQAAMTEVLRKIARQCDGLRCDMAMLLLPEVICRTWGLEAAPFWPEAIRRVREEHPGFTFMAEVYWDLEWELLQQGFGYAYDKRLYDRLVRGEAPPVRAHLAAPVAFQQQLARFLENHDEPRAATTFPWDKHQAAAVITYFAPGLAFFHEGQLEGRRKHIAVHLCRGPSEPLNIDCRAFYARLLDVRRHPAIATGSWQLLNATPAWPNNPTNDQFIVFAWCAQNETNPPLLVAVNYAAGQGQCYVRLPFLGIAGQLVHLTDLLGTAQYERSGDALVSPGLYLDLPPWGHHVFVLDEH